MKIFLKIVLLVACMLAVSGAAVGNNLQGEAFTDPEDVQQMPSGWEKQPVNHVEETGEVDLVVTLDQHLYMFLPQMIDEYGAEHGLKIAVSEGTCGITAGKMVRKAADIGGYCCPPGKTDRLPGLRFHTLGILPLEIIVHPDNPIENITLQEARAIFQGRIYRWDELSNSQGKPGLDLAIQTIGRLHCKTRPGHWRLLLDNEDLFGPMLQEVGTIPDMISLVADAPDAVGYEVGMMVERYRNEGMVKSLMVDGFAPTTSNLLAGRYPLYRTLNLTTWEGEAVENPEAVKLVLYLLGQGKILEELFRLVPVTALRREGWRFLDNELIGEPR
jgi:ABC-type phosphate transport system substrate-binding protein